MNQSTEYKLSYGYKRHMSGFSATLLNTLIKRDDEHINTQTVSTENLSGDG